MKTQKEILRFIESVRHSFPDASIIYKFGACYGFYEILKTFEPSAVAYVEVDGDHILTKIGSAFYDVDGEFMHEDKEKATKMTAKEHRRWKTNVSAQRVEWILAKYYRRCEQIKKDV